MRKDRIGPHARPFPQATDGFFSCGSYQPKSLTRTFDLSRSTFRAHIPNEVGNLFFDVRDMFFEPIDKTFEESSEWGSIKLSCGSNQLLTEYITIQSIRNTRKNTLSSTTVRRDVQHTDGLSSHDLPSSVFRDLVRKGQLPRRHEGQPPFPYGLGVSILVGAGLPLAVCQHVGHFAHDTRGCLPDFIKTEEVVTVCCSSTLKGVVGSPPLTDITVLPPTATDRTCHLEGSRFAAGRRSKEVEPTTFKATGFKKRSCEGKSNCQFQQRIAETGNRHVFLPSFESSRRLKNIR